MITTLALLEPPVVGNVVVEGINAKLVRLLVVIDLTPELVSLPVGVQL